MRDAMTLPPKERTYCADLSLQANEPLFATAPQSLAYLLLEYGGNWGVKALEESAIPQTVKERLDDLARRVPGLKTLLIKTHRQEQRQNQVRFFVAAISLNPPRIYEFHLESYANLLDLDIPAILAGDVLYESCRRDAPLYLVCTNGRRDLCCAHYGLPVYNALVSATKSGHQPLVWQSSHVGGHRFAPNLLCLPHGLMYGRVDADAAMAIVDADMNGRLLLPNLRGRVQDPPIAQAAEFYLRQNTLGERLDSCRLVDLQEGTSGEWQVRFHIQPADTFLTVKVSTAISQEQVFESCSLDKTTPVVRYEFQLVGG